jgi:hypothetical protein
MSIFPLQNCRLHLRYRHLIDEKFLLKCLKKGVETEKRQICGFSIVQDQSSDEMEENFLHTHAYIETTSEMRFRNDTPFAIGTIKPFIKKVVDNAHKRNILKYHDSKKRKPYTDIDRNEGVEGVDEKKKIRSVRTRPMREVRDGVYECKDEKSVLDTFEESSLAGDLSCLLSIWKTKPREPKLPGGSRDDWYNWKKELYDELTLDVVDPRKIIFYVNSIGLGGKSSFVQYMVDHVEGVVQIGANSMYHVATLLVDYLASGQTIDIILIDIAKDGTISPGFYETIEMLKNGKFSSQKYRGKMVNIPTPKIVVFCNQLPHLEKLSPDRWDVRFLSPECDIFHRIEGKKLREEYLDSGEDSNFFSKYIESLPIKNKMMLRIKA